MIYVMYDAYIIVKMRWVWRRHIMSWQNSRSAYISIYIPRKLLLIMRSPGSSNTVDATSTRIALDLFEIKRCLVHEGASMALLHSDFFRFELLWDWQSPWFLLVSLTWNSTLLELAWWVPHNGAGHDHQSPLELGMTWMLVKVRTCIVKEKLLDTSFKQFGSGQVHSQWSSAFGCSCRQGDFLPKRDAVVFVDILPGGASSCSQHQPFRSRLAGAALVLCLTFRCVSWEEVVDRGKPFATWEGWEGLKLKDSEGERIRLAFWLFESFAGCTMEAHYWVILFRCQFLKSWVHWVHCIRCPRCPGMFRIWCEVLRQLPWRCRS